MKHSTFATVACLFLAGCSDAEVKQVNGQVLLDGTPMDKVEVLFWPERDQTLGILVCRGTDAEGNFQITPIVEQGQGRAGDYVVSVTDPEAKQWIIAMVITGQDNMKLPNGRRLPPRMYWNISSTPLRATVDLGVTDLEPFELRSR